MRDAARRAIMAAGWTGTIAAAPVIHWSLTTGQLRPLAAVLSLCQVATVGSVVVRGNAAGLWLLAAVMALLLLLRFGPGAGTLGLVAASGASHAVIYLSLTAVFAASLRPGRDSLITSLARRLRGGLDPAMEAYTRGVTMAWCGFFVAQLAASLLLFLLAPRAVWSLFVNVLDFPLAVLMFAAEYGVRRLRFRNAPHIPIADTIRSFANSSAKGDRPETHRL